MKDSIEKIKKMYWFWCFLLVFLTSYLFPYIMDYYVLRPNEDFFEFYSFHIVGNMTLLNISTILIALMILIVYALSYRIDVSLLIVMALLVILSYASHIKYDARNEMLNYMDFTVTDAGNVAAEYIAWDFSSYFMGMLVFVIGVSGLGVLVEKKCGEIKRTKNRLIIRGTIGVVSILTLIFIIPTMINNAVGLVEKVINKGNSSSINNVLYNFLKKDGFVYDDVDIETAFDNLLEKSEDFESGYIGESETRKANIIVIMNESWWDITPLLADSVVCSSDPMKTWNELAGKCDAGSVAVNVYGGGTITSETEFLMGVNLNYFSSTVGVSEYLRKKDNIASIITYFNNLDYYTTAIHPYSEDFYYRDEIYDKYGFDKMIFDNDMKYIDRYDEYISDESLAKQIIYEYENKDDDPLFVWAVSIAGHATGLDGSSEFNDNYNYPIGVSCNNGGLSDEEVTELQRTINNFYLACEAYKTLVDYFEAVDEKTVILMFGDHAPSISTTMNHLLGYDVVNANETQLYDLYTTPILMWSNVAVNNEIEISGNNIQYLDAALLEYAGLPDCEMTRMIRYINSQIKTNSAKILKDANDINITEFTSEQKDVYLNYGALVDEIILGTRDFSSVWK